tara:strand:+ start:75 stop:824 length:750 start_codon:yes stop_codon:yes gene_type:complete
MPVIYSSSTGNTDDVYLSRLGESSWANARDGTSSTFGSDAVSAATTFTYVYKDVNPRDGSMVYGVRRSFMVFDTSGISGTVASAELSVRGYHSNDGSVIAVKSDAYGGDGGTNWSSSDFNNIVGWSAGSSLDGLATIYGAAKTTTNWTKSDWNDFAATSDLLTDMKNNDVVIVCFMDYTNDYLNVAPSTGSFLNCGGYYAEKTSPDYRPHIAYTLAATGYANNVNGIAAANIGKINGIATASISKVNGI